MTAIERLQTTLGSLGLTALEARLEGLLEHAAKTEPSYAEFLQDALGAEAEARRQRYLKTRLQLSHLPYMKTFAQFDFSVFSRPSTSGRCASCRPCALCMRPVMSSCWGRRVWAKLIWRWPWRKPPSRPDKRRIS